VNSNRKKVFIAINPPEKVKDQLIALMRSDDFALLPIRWSDRDNLHITLEFLGLVEDDDLYKVVARLHELKDELSEKLAYLSLGFSKIAPGPTSDDPTMLWALGEENRNLTEATNVLADAFSDIRIIRSGKRHEFTPHITLGRIEKEEIKNFKMQEKKIKISFSIESIELMESFKEKNKIRYITLETIKL